MDTPHIKSATEAEADQAVAVIALAFIRDPVFRWLYQDPYEFLTEMPTFVRAYGGKAFQHQTGHYVDGFSGAALWLPPGVHQDEEELNAVFERIRPDQVREETLAIGEQLARYHPSEEPCWYLSIIGVDPAQQGKGYGAALLQYALRACDEAHTVAYLESTNPGNIPLYERHGFEVMGEIQVGSSPPVHPMLRSPRT